jgi:hypothetical protein
VSWEAALGLRLERRATPKKRLILRNDAAGDSWPLFFTEKDY